MGAIAGGTSSLVEFVYVFADKLTGFRRNFISYILIAQLLFARGFFSVVNYRIIIAN